MGETVSLSEPLRTSWKALKLNSLWMWMEFVFFKLAKLWNWHKARNDVKFGRIGNWVLFVQTTKFWQCFGLNLSAKLCAGHVAGAMRSSRHRATMKENEVSALNGRPDGFSVIGSNELWKLFRSLSKLINRHLPPAEFFSDFKIQQSRKCLNGPKFDIFCKKRSFFSANRFDNVSNGLGWVPIDARGNWEKKVHRVCFHTILNYLPTAWGFRCRRGENYEMSWERDFLISNASLGVLLAASFLVFLSRLNN